MAMAALRQPTLVDKPDRSRYRRQTLFVMKEGGTWGDELALMALLRGPPCSGVSRRHEAVPVRNLLFVPRPKLRRSVMLADASFLKSNLDS
jgi:hypothetical protein